MILPILQKSGVSFLAHPHLGLPVFVILIFAVGLLVRAVLILVGGSQNISMVEPARIAVSLLENGVYADAYGQGVGPTAHCSPLHPFLLAGVIKFFGTGWGGALTASLLASAAAALAYALLPVLSVFCGFGRWPGVVAGLIGALVPVNYWAQTTGTFDAPFTSLALVGLCCMIVRAGRDETFTIGHGALLGFFAGVACLFNPAILQVLLGWGLLGFWLFRRKAGQFLRFYAALGALVIIVLSPWAIRNTLTFGKAIFTRSNFGLELQVSNNDLAVAELDRNTRSLKAAHPYSNAGERDKVRQMGEIPYQAAKQKEAFAWIQSHPGTFAHLTFQRMTYFWFPPMVRAWQAVIEAGISVLGICGVIALLRSRQAGGMLIALVVVIYPIIYYTVQASPRYRFPIEALMLLTGAKLMFDVLAKFKAFNR